jgi:ABC-2 type transport system ATP-binding protein
MLLQTQNLTKSYNRTRVVDGVGLAVEPGDIYGFLGPNGAGKTTTIRLLMGIIAADNGIIELFGRRLKRPGNVEKLDIGYVSQDQHFYAWMTAVQLGEFVGAFYPRWDQSHFLHLLDRLDVPPDRKTAALSGGMQVKLALALALAHRPPLLILDEPTSGLDPLTRRDFLDLIRHQAREEGRTVFFSSHLIDDLEDTATKVGVLRKGHLLYQGAPADLCREIRAMTLADGQELPVGFDVLSRDKERVVVRAPVATWASSELDRTASALSLEEAFVALVRHHDA